MPDGKKRKWSSRFSKWSPQKEKGIQMQNNEDHILQRRGRAIEVVETGGAPDGAQPRFNPLLLNNIGTTPTFIHSATTPFEGIGNTLLKNEAIRLKGLRELLKEVVLKNNLRSNDVIPEANIKVAGMELILDLLSRYQKKLIETIGAKKSEHEAVLGFISLLPNLALTEHVSFDEIFNSLDDVSKEILYEGIRILNKGGFDVMTHYLEDLLKIKNSKKPDLSYELSELEPEPLTVQKQPSTIIGTQPISPKVLMVDDPLINKGCNDTLKIDPPDHLAEQVPDDRMHTIGFDDESDQQMAHDSIAINDSEEGKIFKLTDEALSAADVMELDVLGYTTIMEVVFRDHLEALKKAIKNARTPEDIFMFLIDLSDNTPLEKVFNELNKQTQIFIQHSLCEIGKYAGYRGMRHFLRFPGEIKEKTADAVVIRSGNKAHKIIQRHRQKFATGSKADKFLKRVGGQGNLSRDEILDAYPEPERKEVIRMIEETDMAKRFSESAGFAPVDEIIFDEEGPICIITEWIVGGYIDAKLIPNGDPEVISVKDKVRDFIEIAEQLEMVHLQGWIHRDLKPQNILTDGNGRPRIIDFGIARPVKRTKELTAFGATLGTPSYMSPEQGIHMVMPMLDENKTGLMAGDIARMATLKNSKTCDIYALGVIMYQMLTGRLPIPFPSEEFESDEAFVHRFILNKFEDTPDPINFDPILDDIVMKCLSVQPWERPEDATALKQGLQAYLDRS